MAIKGNPRIKNPLVYQAARMKEVELQDAILKYIATLGIWEVHYTPDWMFRLAIQSLKTTNRRGDRDWSPPGFPDIVLIQKADIPSSPHRHIYFELKTTKGRLEEGQVAWSRALAAIPGVEWYEVRALDWLEGRVDRILNQGPEPDQTFAYKLAQYGMKVVPIEEEPDEQDG